MPFELENTRNEVRENLNWLYNQEYRTGENQATEALFKWFFFSQSTTQKRFLSSACDLRGRRSNWKKLDLQLRGRRGTPDAVIRLVDNSQVLFEVKTKQNAVSRKQLIRHLRDAGLKKSGKSRQKTPKLVLITPDYREPRKLRQLSATDRAAILWVPWIEIIVFLTKKLRGGLISSDRLLRDGLRVFLTEHKTISSYLPRSS